MYIHNNKGFTIVELLIVIVVIAILATISVVAYNGIQTNANDSRRKSDLVRIQKAIELYYADNNVYPSLTSAGYCIDVWAGRTDITCWDDLMSDLKLPVMRDPLSRDDGTACVFPNPRTTRSYYYRPLNDGQGYQLGAYLEGIDATSPEYNIDTVGGRACGNYTNFLLVDK